jgi:hypothetical protein
VTQVVLKLTPTWPSFNAPDGWRHHGTAGECDPLALMQFRTRAEAYRAISECTYAGHRGGRRMTCPYKPLEFNVVIELDPVEEKTAGGIILPPSTKEADKLACEEGTLVAI